MITVSALNELPHVRHAFFTREGGVSEGIYAGLNCGLGSGDDAAKVRENRARAMAMLDLPPDSLVTVYQAHTSDVVTVDGPWPQDRPPTADAMVTNRRGLALGILTADCAPVLLAAADRSVVGAAHAGWKGAIGGVLENTLAAMEALGARRKRIVAAVGPCIAHRSYEVGPDFPAPFLAADPMNKDFFLPSERPGHYLFDLPAFVARRLAKAGVERVVRTPCDTRREEGRFYSYRRATLRGEPDYGRQMSVIVLER